MVKGYRQGKAKIHREKQAPVPYFISQILHGKV